VVVDVMQRVEEVFQDVFDSDQLTIGRETTAADVEGWDSLMHVRLVIAIEKAFQVRFTSSEVAALATVGGLVDLLGRKTRK
jgi:acyl carrier protein